MEFLAEQHRVIVHFPVALLSIYVLMETVNFFVKNDFLGKSSLLILFLGVLFSALAVLTGNQASQLIAGTVKSNNIPSDIIGSHETYATITLWYFVFVLVLKYYFRAKKKSMEIIRIVFVMLALIGGFLIFQTGYIGGELVFEHGVGTKPFLQENSQK